MLTNLYSNYKNLVLAILLSVFTTLSLIPGLIYFNNSAIPSTEMLQQNFEKCIYSTRNIADSNSAESVTYIKNYDVSIYPEVANFKCIGKTFSLSFSDNSLIIYNITSSSLVKYITNLHLAIFLLLALTKKINLFYTFLTFIFFWALYDNHLISIMSVLTIFIYIMTYLCTVTGILDFFDKESILKDVTKLKYSNTLNTLRGVSVLAVFVYHANKSILPGGYLGVDVFIFISGFLISNVIISKLNKGEFSLRNFYHRRIRRLFPALFFTILTTSILSIFTMDSNQYQFLIESSIASIFFVSNYYFKNVNFYTNESMELLPLLHTWSLSLEEQFYLIFPMLLILIFKFKNKIIFIGIIFLSSIYLNVFFENSTDLFYLLHFRFWEFLFGFFCMLIYTQKKVLNKNYSYVGYLLILFCFLFFSEQYILSVIPKLFLSIGFLLIVLSSHADHDKGTLYLIGASSYSFYLFHQPIISAYRRYFDIGLISLLEGLVLFLIVLGLAILSFYCIEKYFLENSSNKINIFLIISFFSTLSFLVVQLNLTLANTSSDESLKYYDSIIPLSAIESKQICENDSNNISSYQDIATVCNYNVTGMEQIIVIGDSHAVNVANTLDQEIDSRYEILNLVGGSGKCLLFGRAFYENIPCTENFYQSFLEIVTKDSLIVISTRLPYWLEESRFNLLEGTAQSTDNIPIETILSKRLSEIAAISENIILIYPIPTLDESIKTIIPMPLEEERSDVAVRLINWKKQSKQSNLLLSGINSKNIINIIPQDILCKDSENFNSGSDCFIVKNGKILYYDDNHLSLSGNKIILEELFNIIKKN